MPAHETTAALWYGLLSLVILFAFSSLGYEIRLAFNLAEKADNDEAWQVARATLHIVGVAMLVASAAVAFSSVEIAMAGDDWRVYFGMSIFATGAFYAYARQCEAKLIEFFREAGLSGADKAAR